VRAEVGHIAAIEGLRGVAVLWVMLFHWVALRDGRFDDAFIGAMAAWAPLEAFVRNGYLGVDLFFIVTGFLLTLPWFRHADTGLPAPDWRSFYARRARRIVPAYYVQLMFLFFLVLPLAYPRIWLESTPFVVHNLGAHLAFLHYTSPLTSSSLTVNGALWTLAIEMQYYLLLPLIAPLFVRWPWRSLAAAAVIATGWRWLAWNDLDFLANLYLELGARAGVTEKGARHLIATQLPAWSLHFALGILAGRAWMLRPRKPAAALEQWLPVGILAVALFGLHAVLRDGTAILGQLGWAAFPVLLALGLGAVVCAPASLLAATVAMPPLVALGRISYSAYLYHLPLLLLCNAYAPASGGSTALPLWIASVVLVAAVSFLFVERPYLHMSGLEHRERA
jgi:peptidoglycan/LPS O-acetylase OafA/YrhL